FSGHAVFLGDFHGRGFGVLGRALIDYDPWILLLAVCGCVAGVMALRRGAHETRPGARSALLVVAAFALPYALVVGAYDVTYERFALPLVPVLACAAAAGVAWLARSARVATRGRVAAFAAVAALVQAAPAAHLAHAHAQVDTSSTAAAWLEAQDPERRSS